MHDLLAPWANFYVIVGSAAAALTGLQFIVIVLIADSPMKSDPKSISAFGTPTVVHFCSTLVLSAILSAPWQLMVHMRWTLLMLAAVSLFYSIRVALKASGQHQYKPVLEDWIWHAASPILAYSVILGGAYFLERDTANALFVIGAMALQLLLTGIHNAWDTVTYVAVERDNENTNERE